MLKRLQKPGRRKPMFYSSGMISLLVLPFMILIFLKSETVLKRQHAMEINMYDPSFFKLPTFTKTYDIVITGDSIKDVHAFYIGQLAIRKLRQLGDTSSTVHFLFSDEANYWEYVEVLNICWEERARNFAPYENHIWVYNPLKPKRKISHHNKKERIMRSCIYRDIPPTPKPALINKIKGYSVLLNPALIPTVILFLILVILRIRSTQSTF